MLTERALLTVTRPQLHILQSIRQQPVDHSSQSCSRSTTMRGMHQAGVLPGIKQTKSTFQTPIGLLKLTNHSIAPRTTHVLNVLGSKTPTKRKVHLHHRPNRALRLFRKGLMCLLIHSSCYKHRLTSRWWPIREPQDKSQAKTTCQSPRPPYWWAHLKPPSGPNKSLSFPL